jgi:DNA-binding transcriptional ArsR family regulator
MSSENTQLGTEFTPAMAHEAASLFFVLSEPTRLLILKALQAQPMSVNQLAQSLNLKQANTSKQLGILHDAGLLARTRQGNQILYAIAIPMVFELCHLVCAHVKNSAKAHADALSQKP